MHVKDIMTYNVITVASDTPVLEAERILNFHKFERLPIVDKGKLVGIVTKDDLLKTHPSEATSLSRWELNYLVSKITVKEVMKRKVVTCSPDTTIEHGVALAQANKVGAMVVVDDTDKVVGIMTTNDVFYKTLNPILGIGVKGVRLLIHEAGDGESMQKVLEAVNKASIPVKVAFTIKLPDEKKNDLVLHLDTSDATKLISAISHLGFKVEVRKTEESITPVC